MKQALLSKLFRIILVLNALALMGMSIPRPAQAAPLAATPTPAPKSMYITVIAVEKNKRITVSAVGFPANTNFKVRVGPFYNFTKQQVTTGTINTGNGGSFKFNVNLPDTVKDVEMVTIRMDSDKKQYSFNAFKNVNTGTVSSDPSNSVPATPVSTPVPISGACQVTSTLPSGSMPTRYDFDAVWTIKNTSGSDWETSAVDFKYVSGEKLHKNAAIYDLPARVKSGESITLRVDMLAPDKAGTYRTGWALIGDRGTLCSLPLTITVK